MPGLCWEVGIFCQLQNLLFSFRTWEKKRIIDPILQVKKLCVIGDHTARKGQSWYPKSGLLILNCMLSCGSIMTHSTFFFCQASSAYYFKIQFHIFGAIGHQVLTFAKVFFLFLFFYLLNIYWAPNIYYLHAAKGMPFWASGAGPRLLHASGHLLPIPYEKDYFYSYRYMNWGLGKAGVQTQMSGLQSWTSWVPPYIYLIPGIKGALIHSAAPYLQTHKLIIS